MGLVHCPPYINFSGTGDLGNAIARLVNRSGSLPTLHEIHNLST
ncbi:MULTISPECIES: hypothetical protein [unclassified Moorena]|nr:MULTISPECIES: hypothetical protein [unclassified Moorena]